MGLSIYMNAQDLRLSRVTGQRLNSLQQTLSRLSSGVKTRSRAGDSFSLGFNERLSAEAREAQAELRNLTDQSSLLQTLEGSLAEATNTLQALRELAQQSASGLLSASDRAMLQERFKATMATLDELSESTRFNGVKLLDGERPQLNLELASEARSTSPSQGLFTLPKLNTNTLGQHTRLLGKARGVFLNPLEQGALRINGVQIRESGEYDDTVSYAFAAGSAIAKANAINASAHLTGVRAQADVNITRGVKALSAITLSSDHWIKVNGHQVSGFRIEDRDSTGSLRQAINSALESTGVFMSVDQQGRALFVAEDGRNITLQFSDIETRNAVAILDPYGDPVNFSDNIDPPEYSHNGDIVAVSYVSGQGSGALLNSPQGSFVGTIEVVDNRFSKPQDGVDYVFEVVKAGELGQALFRVKEEQLLDGESDHEEVELYDFNRFGAELTPPDPHKVRIAGSQYLGGSALELSLSVVRPGAADAVVASERPVVEVFVRSLDDTTLAPVSLGTVSVSNSSTLDLTPLGLEAQLSFPYDNTYRLERLDGSALSFNQALELTNDPAGNDYPLAPVITAWSGMHSSRVKLEVINAGHTLGGTDYSFTDEEPAWVRVTMSPLYQTGTISQDIRLGTENGEFTTELDLTNQAAELGGLTFRFPSARTLSATSNTSVLASSLSGAYQVNPVLYGNRFVNEDAREYVLTFTSTGIMSYQLDDGGPSATVEVYERDASNARVLLQTYTIPEVSTDRAIFLGEDDERDGAYLYFPRGPTIGTTTRSRSFGGSVNFSPYYYNQTTSHTAVVEITSAGDDFGPNAATYRYYYQDDPSTTISSGTLSKRVQMADNTLMTNEVARNWQVETPNLPNNLIYIRDFGYDRNERASFESEIKMVEGELKLETRWRYENSPDDIFYTPLTYDQYQDIGNGMRLYFYGSRMRDAGDFQEGMAWSGNITGFNQFEVGDTITYPIYPNLVNAGDSYELAFDPLDLEVGATWELNAIAPDWKPGDVYSARLGSGFEATAHTLTSSLTYQGGEGALGELKITGAGRFEVGDQIRVHTRGFVGEVRAEGVYTHPLPTEYVFKVTKAGELGDAELTWERADGLTNTERGGRGTLSGLSLGVAAEIEEGFSVVFDDLGEGLYLAEGDEFIVPVGRNLNYTFGGQLSLISEGKAQVSYSDEGVDQQLGRLLFTGTEEQAQTPHYAELSLSRALVTPTLDSALANSEVVSVESSRRAIESVDVALNQVLKARAQVGAMSSKLERRALALEGKVFELSSIQERVSGVDVSAEALKSATEQIQLMSASQLRQISKADALRVLDLIRGLEG